MTIRSEYDTETNPEDYDEITEEHNGENSVVITTSYSPVCEQDKVRRNMTMHLEWQQAIELAYEILIEAKKAEHWDMKHEVINFMLRQK